MRLAVRINGAWTRIGSSVRIGEIIYTREALERMTPQARAELGVVEYAAAEAVPAGQRSLGTYLDDAGGSPVEKHTLEAVPLAERKAALLAAIDAERDRRQQEDFSYDFGETPAQDDTGAVIQAGPRALQMRFEPDQRNWQALQSQALVVPEAARGEVIMPMRAEDNWNIATTAEQVIAVTSALVARNAAILFHGGALKSQVRAASTSAALDAINISAGWP